MNWNDLKFFLVLAREGTISGAGRNLNVKHTTVARRIAALETSLGTRLFDKSRSGYVMTQAAEDLYQQAISMEEKVSNINVIGKTSINFLMTFINHTIVCIDYLRPEKLSVLPCKTVSGS